MSFHRRRARAASISRRPMRSNAEHVRERGTAGGGPVGVKVGYANKAMWRALKLDTLVWAHMYDDTVRYCGERSRRRCRSMRMTAPKIEPEIVFKLAAPLPEGAADASGRAAVGRVARARLRDHRQRLRRLEVSARRLRCLVRPARRADCRRRRFASTQSNRAQPRRGARRLQGAACRRAAPSSPKAQARIHSRSPALCASANSRRRFARRRTPSRWPRAISISSGTLTESQLIATGETWTATVEGLDLRRLRSESSEGSMRRCGDLALLKAAPDRNI